MDGESPCSLRVKLFIRKSGEGHTCAGRRGFADEQYSQKIYINLLDLSGELFLEQYRELWREMKSGKRYQNPIYELIKRYQPDFEDSENTIVIIDEIQESADIYNCIREFTRTLKCDFIVTGSYLGRILKKEFKYSSGDLDYLEICTLGFEEFLTALNRIDQYEKMSLCGGSNAEIYQELQALYNDYCMIGGYPGVVLKYLENAPLQECQAELLKIIRLFTNESMRYFEDILDAAVYENLFSGVARILDFKAKTRYYFMDIGLANYFLTKAGVPKAVISGIINENFVYLDLRRRIAHPSEIALEPPAFATLGNGEIDFYVKELASERTYVVEVKSGKNSGKTETEVLEKKNSD